MAAKKTRWAFWPLACLLAAGCGPSSSVAPAPAPQNPPPAQTENKFHLVSTYDAPYFSLKKMEIFGKTDSSLLADAGIPIRDFLINTYRLVTNNTGQVTNALEMIISAPECLFNRSESEGSSAGPLQVRTADGRFQIAGKGYLWQEKDTSATLTISNDVATIIEEQMLATNNTGPNDTNRVIHIDSDHFHFDRNANLITYSDHVHAEDDQLNLVCDVMNIHRLPSGGVSDLVADGNIAIVDKSTQGRATGDHAVYDAASGAQEVTLTGNPHWLDGPSEATADAFVFDRERRTIQARGNAHARLPANSIGDSGFALMPQAGAATASSVPAMRLVDVFSDVLNLQLPPTNGPVREIIAEHNVRIVDAQGTNRASGDRADYTAENGVLILSGGAQWESGLRLARAETLTFDRTNQTFAALTNAYLKIPVSTLGQSPAFGGMAARNPAAADQFVEVTSDSYDYRDEALTFHDHVRAKLLEENMERGNLESGKLTVRWQGIVSGDGRHTNEVLRSIVAEDDVRARQLPTQMMNGKTVEGGFNAARVEITLRTSGLLENVVATGGIRATRTETPANGRTPVYLTMTADNMNASFKPDTNAVDVLTANQHVVMTRADEKATGEKVVYTATNDMAVLTGNPRLEEPHRVWTSDDAIIYDRAHGKIATRGNAQMLTDLPPGSLGQSNLPSLNGGKTN